MPELPDTFYPLYQHPLEDTAVRYITNVLMPVMTNVWGEIDAMLLVWPVERLALQAHHQFGRWVRNNCGLWQLTESEMGMYQAELRTAIIERGWEAPGPEYLAPHADHLSHLILSFTLNIRAQQRGLV